MSFNNGKKTKAFENNWKKLRKEYAEAGMTAEAIDEMYNFDKKVFLGERRYIEHTQALTLQFHDFGPAEVPNSLVAKYDGFSTSFSETDLTYLFGWMEDIEDDTLFEKLKELSEKDLQILTLYSQYGYSQEKIAKLYCCNQATICRKFTKIENVLKMCIKNGFSSATE